MLGAFVLLFPTRLFASILIGLQDMAVTTVAQAAGWALTTVQRWGWCCSPGPDCTRW